MSTTVWETCSLHKCGNLIVSYCKQPEYFNPPVVTHAPSAFIFASSISHQTSQLSDLQTNACDQTPQFTVGMSSSSFHQKC